MTTPHIYIEATPEILLNNLDLIKTHFDIKDVFNIQGTTWFCLESFAIPDYLVGKYVQLEIKTATNISANILTHSTFFEFKDKH